MSSADMLNKIQRHVGSFNAKEDNLAAAAEFRKTTGVHFVHSVCSIEGESLHSVEDALQAIKLWRCCTKGRIGGESKCKESTRKPFSIQSPEKKMLTMSLLDAGFDSLLETETCLRGGVSRSSLNADKLHATLALYVALKLVEGWETEPYPLLDVFKIKQLHSVLFESTGDSHSAGTYRSTSAWTRQMNGEVHTYLSHGKIAKALNGLVRKVNTTIAEIFSEQNRTNLVPKLFHLVSSFFLEFEEIHPFHDGNGRVGRLLAAYLLAPVTPFGPNVLYFHSLNKPELQGGHFIFVNREPFLESIQDDAEDGHPTRLAALFIEGVYVAWEMFSHLSSSPVMQLCQTSSNSEASLESCN
ncbi:hypothetical protein L7F22_036053 [Adiantum nelumboides]|nr:hypothetical protein [Adiantum nelumboides]